MVNFHDDRLIVLIFLFILILPVSNYSQEIMHCNNSLFILERKHALFHPDKENSLRLKFNMHSYSSFDTRFHDRDDKDFYHDLQLEVCFRSKLTPYYIKANFICCSKPGGPKDLFPYSLLVLRSISNTSNMLIK